jgi:hypothetical protein
MLKCDHQQRRSHTSFTRPDACRLEISVWYGNPSASARFWMASTSLLEGLMFEPAVLAARRLRVVRVASSLSLAAGGGLPFSALDRLEQLLLVGRQRDITIVRCASLSGDGQVAEPAAG